MAADANPEISRSQQRCPNEERSPGSTRDSGISLENELGGSPRQRQTQVALVIFAALFLPLLCGLGVWQLNRAEQKEQLLVEREERLSRAVLSGEWLLSEPGDWQHRQAVLTGYYQEDRQWLLDNRTHRGRVGYEVVSLFRLESGAGVLLVNRGWIAAPNRREILPELPVPQGLQQLTGVVEAVERPHWVLQELPPEAGWPKRMQYASLEHMQSEAGQELAPWLVRLEEGQPGALTAMPRMSPMGPETHRGYAVQWFGLALVLLTGTVIALVKTRKEKS